MTTPPLPDTIEHFLFLQSHPLITNKNFSPEFKNKLMLRLLQIPPEDFKTYRLDEPSIKQGRKFRRERISAILTRSINFVEFVKLQFNIRSFSKDDGYDKLQMPPYNPII